MAGRHVTNSFTLKVLEKVGRVQSSSKCGKACTIAPISSHSSKIFRILHKDGFSKQDLELIKPVVYSNCIHSMLAILRAMFHLQIEYADQERVKDSQLVFATVHANREELTEELSAAMQRLWKDDGVQECYRRSNEYQIDDSAK